MTFLAKFRKGGFLGLFGGVIIVARMHEGTVAGAYTAALIEARDTNVTLLEVREE
jgi:hypothetical protein